MTRWRISLFALVACVSGLPALASDGSDMVAAMSGICITSLETGAAVGPGLSRADADMEEKLLNGKIGKIWRTWNARVVVVAHASGDTCEVMGINVVPSDFALALSDWRKETRPEYEIDAEAAMPDTAPGGAYLAAQLPSGDFIQMFIQSQPDARFIGVTVARVNDSVQARELLGL